MLPVSLVVAATAFGVLALLPPVHSRAPCDEFFYLVQYVLRRPSSVHLLT